jgi:copper transport protein
MKRRRLLASAGGAVLALGVAWGPATAAWAHAVLLNAVPGAQQTLSSPPPEVQLQFSEPVEAQFGTIRVVDNNGHDVTTGGLLRTQGGRLVSVAIRPHAGTNIVIWQVVSSDGHVERGNYEFFLGAPSKTPPHITASQQVASPAAGWTYGTFRFGWFAGLFALIGLVVVWTLVWRPVAAAGETATAAAPALTRGIRRFRWALAGAWVLLVVCGVGVLVGQAAADAGRSLGWAAQPSSVKEVLKTSAGHYWRDALILAAALIVPVAVTIVAAGRSRRGWRWVERSAIALLLAMAAGVALATAQEGHARTVGHSATGVPALTIHLVAVGVWVGGLGALLLLVTVAWRDLAGESRARFAGEMVRRYSRLAIGAVAAVITTGLIAALIDLNSPSDLVNLPYGRMLLIKIVLLQLALVFGARHLWFGPAASGDGSGHGPGDVESFPRSALAELGVLGLALVAASSLMVMVPGKAVAAASIAELDLQKQAGAYTVNVTVTPNQPGEDQIYVLFRDQRGVPAPGIIASSAVLTGIDLQQPIGLVWIANGRFTGSIDLPSASHYGLLVTSGQGDTANFSFKVAGLTSSTS